MTENPCAIAAPRYAASGLAVFPVPPGTKMSYKAARDYAGRAWGATKDADEIKRDWERWPRANLGIVTGAISGIFVVETDTAAHGEGVDGEAALRALIGQRAWPETLQALSPSGSRHYYFLWPNWKNLVIRNSTSKLAPGVDIRGEGGMVVAPPSVKNGVAYRWANKCLINNAPLWLLELLIEREHTTVARDSNSHELLHPAFVRETMRHVPTEQNWHERNAIVGLAIFNCTGGSQEGFEIWDEWLQRSGRYRPGEGAKRWRQIHNSPPNRIGYGTLRYLATKANPHWESELDKEFLAMNKVRMKEE